MKNKKEKITTGVAIGKDVPVCQNCKAHRNNPSFCNLKKSYTGRKNTCEDFKM